MISKLQQEIKQSKPFETLEREVFLNLARTTAVLTHRLEQEFKPFGLTLTQYNLLRIVRGAEESGILQGDIAERMVTSTPDIPRLLKRLETSNLIRRKPDTKDLRVLTVYLTTTGSQLLSEMDEFLREINGIFFSGLSRSELKKLNELLSAAR